MGTCNLTGPRSASLSSVRYVINLVRESWDDQQADSNKSVSTLVLRCCQIAATNCNTTINVWCLYRAMGSKRVESVWAHLKTIKCTLSY